MSDGETPTPAPRRRPSYGLPAPTSPAPGAAPSFGAPSADGRPLGNQPSGNQYSGDQHSGHQHSGHQSFGAPSHGAPSGYGDGAHYGDGSPYGNASPYAESAHGGPSGYGPRTGPLPSMGSPAPAPRRRRGLVPLIIGLVLLLLVGPVATVGGIVWSMSSLVGDASAGPTALAGSNGEVEVAGNEMLIVYVPEADAGTAECTAEGSSPGAVSVVPSRSSVTFGDGSRYEQLIGVATLEDTTVTITCTGTDAPAYLGPYSVLGMAGPLLIGPIIGLFAGLIGLVLTIIGIVKLVRSRRS